MSAPEDHPDFIGYAIWSSLWAEYVLVAIHRTETAARAHVELLWAEFEGTKGPLQWSGIDPNYLDAQPGWHSTPGGWSIDPTYYAPTTEEPTP